MKHRKILFVCTGNTCRSPMAEAALRAELKRRKIGWYRVSSAGLAAEEGSPMTLESVRALSEAGIPFDPEFRARRLTEKMAEEAYAIVCMTRAQKHALEKFPNVTCFYELCGREIPDPYGCGMDVYRVTLRNIRECLSEIAVRLCPKIGGKEES